MNKFGDAIRTQREAKELLLRHVAAEMDVDTAMLSKIERGERRTKREQVIQLAKILELDKNKLLTLWLADRVYEIMLNENTNVVIDALETVKDTLKKK